MKYCAPEPRSRRQAIFIMIWEVTADFCSIATYTKKYDGDFKITYHYVSDLVGGLFCFRSTFISGKMAKNTG